MKTAIRITGFLFCCLVGLVTTFVLGFMIEGIIIPDPCEYHSKETTWLFDLFYKMISDEGYHPSPTTFNYVVTISLGIALGIFINNNIAKAMAD